MEETLTQPTPFGPIEQSLPRSHTLVDQLILYLTMNQTMQASSAEQLAVAWYNDDTEDTSCFADGPDHPGDDSESYSSEQYSLTSHSKSAHPNELDGVSERWSVTVENYIITINQIKEVPEPVMNITKEERDYDEDSEIETESSSSPSVSNKYESTEIVQKTCDEATLLLPGEETWHWQRMTAPAGPVTDKESEDDQSESSDCIHSLCDEVEVYSFEEEEVVEDEILEEHNFEEIVGEYKCEARPSIEAKCEDAPDDQDEVQSEADSEVDSSQTSEGDSLKTEETVEEVESSETESILEPNTILVLCTQQSADRDVTTRQQQTFALLDAHDVPYTTLEGDNPENHELRNLLFDLSGLRGCYPQLFLCTSQGEAAFWGVWPDLERANEKGLSLKQLLWEDPSSMESTGNEMSSTGEWGDPQDETVSSLLLYDKEVKHSMETSEEAECSEVYSTCDAGPMPEDDSVYQTSGQNIAEERWSRMEYTAGENDEKDGEEEEEGEEEKERLLQELDIQTTASSHAEESVPPQHGGSSAHLPPGMVQDRSTESLSVDDGSSRESRKERTNNETLISVETQPNDHRYSMRPGIVRGLSFDSSVDGCSTTEKTQSMHSESTQSETAPVEAEGTVDDSPFAPTLRPGMFRGLSCEKIDCDEVIQKENEEEESIGPKHVSPMYACSTFGSMRPGMIRGLSFEKMENKERKQGSHATQDNANAAESASFQRCSPSGYMRPGMIRGLSFEKVDMDLEGSERTTAPNKIGYESELLLPPQANRGFRVETDDNPSENALVGTKIPTFLNNNNISISNVFPARNDTSGEKLMLKMKPFELTNQPRMDSLDGSLQKVQSSKYKPKKYDQSVKKQRAQKGKSSRVLPREVENPAFNCYQWYNRLGRPSRADMKRRVKSLPVSCGVSPEHVDLLPWENGGSALELHAMLELIVGKRNDHQR